MLKLRQLAEAPPAEDICFASSMRRYAKRDRVKAFHIPAVTVGKEEGHLRSRLRTNAKFPPPYLGPENAGVVRRHHGRTLPPL